VTPEQRRQWVRVVLGHEDLTSAHKVVLMALETYADYRDGTNARPGEVNLARVSGLGVRAVRYALERGQQLGLIERTSAANSRAGLAAVYRLVPQSFTGTPVPVNESTTGTAVPVNNSTTGMRVPVKPVTTGTAVHHDRHAQTPRPAQPQHHDRHSGASHLSNTLPTPSNHQGGYVSRERHLAAVPDLGSPPSPRCPNHQNAPSPVGCGPCGDARIFRRDWETAHAAAKAQAITDCAICDRDGWARDDEGAPTIQCTHQPPTEAAHA
jgi:hypothetical protein